jgi:hypothetical protein
MEDGGFEIEIILQEKPKSNVFAFQIEAAQDLDFFDQPKLSPEEIAEGAVRPENANGSNAVYPKTKANHRVGDTLYSTGKACHTYRSEGSFSDFASEVHSFGQSPREQPCGQPYKGEQKNCWPPRSQIRRARLELGLSAGTPESIHRGMAGYTG